MRRQQVVEDDRERQQRADAGQHLQQLERIDVFLAAQQHARAARQDQRILAEERADRVEDRAALVGLADVERVRAEVDARYLATVIVRPMPPTASSRSSTVTG